MALYNRRPIYRGALAGLMAAIKQLRVWDSQWVDLSYPDGDPRGAIPDAEMPPEYITERDYLRREIVRCAALVGGENDTDAITFADTPLASANPYNLDRVAEAVAIFTGESF